MLNIDPATKIGQKWEITGEKNVRFLTKTYYPKPYNRYHNTPTLDFSSWVPKCSLGSIGRESKMFTRLNSFRLYANNGFHGNHLQYEYHGIARKSSITLSFFVVEVSN